MNYIYHGEFQDVYDYALLIKAQANMVANEPFKVKSSRKSQLKDTNKKSINIKRKCLKK